MFIHLTFLYTGHTSIYILTANFFMSATDDTKEKLQITMAILHLNPIEIQK